MQPSLGVIIVHFGPPEPTLACLRSVLDDRSTAARRLVVVDNRGDLPAPPAPVTLVRCPENPGFGAAANRGAEAIDGEDLDGFVILNGDVRLIGGYLDAAVRALSDGAGASAGPLFLDREDGDLWFAGGGFNRWTGTVWQSHSPDDALRSRDVGFLPGAAIAVDRRAWHESGGFDPRFFLYHEDLDLCLRLRRRGWRLRFAPEMKAVHNLGTATGSRDRSPLYLENVTRTRLLPHRSRTYRLYLAALHTGWVLLRGAAIALAQGGAGRDKVQALWRGHRRALAGAWRG